MKSSVLPALSILFPRPTQSQGLQLFHVGPKLQIPNQHSAAVAHLSAPFLHRRVSVKQEKNWKLFQRKPSVLNIEEQLLPLSASYVLPNLVNLTLLCRKISVSPGHTADSCSCPSGPASLFLQRCHLASCSQNGKPIQCARLSPSLPSHSPCWPILPECPSPSEWQLCSPCSALTVSPNLMSHVNVLRRHSAPPPRSLMRMLDRAAPAPSPEVQCLAHAVGWTLIL